jgi:Threonine dehydrogenase and related Zn-dependent dehydrogenases
MKALVYEGPGKKSWTEVPDPVIQHPTDVIVKMEATTICGTDLHILKGTSPRWPRVACSGTRASASSPRSAPGSPSSRWAIG